MIISNDPLWCLTQKEFEHDRFTFIVDTDFKKHSGIWQETSNAMTYTKEELEPYKNKIIYKMQLVTEPDIYSPSLDELGNYIDKIPSFNIIKKTSTF